MSKRMIRVNELLRRELSEQLRQRYRDSAAAVTISEVDTSPDLRRASIYYAVLGGAPALHQAEQLFRRIGKDLRQQVARRVTLKYMPAFEFIHDPSMERGAHILGLLDDLDTAEENQSHER